MAKSKFYDGPINFFLRNRRQKCDFILCIHIVSQKQTLCVDFHKIHICMYTCKFKMPAASHVTTFKMT